MAELKTKVNNKSVVDFLNSIDKEQKREDCFKILQLMQNIVKEQPKMWGDSIIGFGSYHYKYASGREGDWFKIGFAPRKQNISLYLMMYGFDKAEHILKKLGKYKTGKGCLYISKLSDIDFDVLKELIGFSTKHN